MVGMGFDSTPRFPVEVLEKTESYIIERTSTGAINKNFRDYSTTPQLLERPIKEKKDWLPIKERLYPDYTRVNWVSAFNTYHRARSEGKFITVNGGWGYDILQGYIRSDQLLMAMATDPDWIREMILTLANLNLKMIKMMMDKGLKFDGAFFYNDMGYRNDLLFPRRLIAKLIKKLMRWYFLFVMNMICPSFYILAAG